MVCERERRDHWEVRSIWLDSRQLFKRMVLYRYRNDIISKIIV